MLEKLSISSKIGMLVGMSAAVVAVIGVVSVSRTTQQIRDGRRAEVVNVVQSAHAIIAGYRARAAAGALSVDDAQKAAKDALRPARYGGPDGQANYVYIFTVDGKSVMHPIRTEWEGQSWVGKVKEPDNSDLVTKFVDAIAASKDGRAYVDTHFPRPGQTEALPKLQYLEKVEGWNWMVGSGLYTDDVDAQVRDALVANLVVALAVLATLGGIGWAISRSVQRQIGGEPSEAIAVMFQVAQGNLAVQLGQPQPGSVLDALSRMVAGLRQTVTAVRQATDSINTAAIEIATGNADLSARTESQASSLQETASSMEELTATVKQNADNARQANQLAVSAAEVAVKGGEVVSRVVGTMSEISASSKKIADIIAVIDGIAFQTNILALNAAVEAARAGEQGRGFAVVASEVRSLAQRSAAAAKEIKTLITESVDKVDSGHRLVEAAGATMNEIVTSVKRVTDIIAEITAASQEQSSGIEQVNQAVMQMDEATQQNAALVEQAAAAAESMQEQAQKLASAVSVFRLAEGTTAPAPLAKKATVTPLPRKAPATLRNPAPLKKVANSTHPAASTTDSDDWEEF